MKDRITNHGSIFSNMIALAIELGVFFWILESAIDVLVFHEGSFVRQILSPDTNELWMRLVVVCILIGFGVYAQFMITKRRRAEERVEHLNLVLRAIRNINQLITRERDRDRLLQGACDNLTETRGYHSAWIALLDESGELVTTAGAGLGEDFLPLVEQLNRGELPACARMALSQSGVVIIEDRASTCAGCPLSKNHGNMAAMAVRLEHGEKVYGVLTIHTLTDFVADEEERSLFQEVAADIAFALRSIELEEERKRTEEALRRRAEELTALQATVLDITAPHDLPTLLETIVERATQLLNRPSGGMYLCNPDREEARCVVSYNTPDDYIGTVLKYSEGAAGIVAQTGEPLIIDDYRTWSRRAAVYEEEQPFTAVLSAPMIWKGQVTGVIHVLDDVETKRFTQADLELLTLFANHAAIAVENTRLYEEAQKEILERKRAEEEIGRLAKFPSENPNPVLRVAKDGTILYTNEASLSLLNLWGCQVGQLLPDDWRKLTLDVFSSGSSKEAEVEVGDRILSLTFAPVVDADYVNVYGLDITERKRAEAALRESEALYHSLVESLPQNIFRKDSDGRFTFANQRFCTTQGKPLAEIIGKTDFDLHPPDLAKKYQEDDQRIIEAGEIFETVEEHQPLGGEKIYVRVVKTPIYDSKGQAAGIQGIFWDITERKRAEEALRRSEKQASAAIEAARGFTFSYDITTGKIIWGGAIEEITGYTPEEFAQVDIEGWTERIHSEDRDKVLSILQEAIQKKDRATAEYRFKTKKGYVVLSSISLTEKEHGKAVRLVGILQDITERKRAEEALKEYSERLEEMVEERTQELRDAQEQLVRREKLAILGQLAGGVGHELRNPLGVISNAVYFLQMTLTEADETTKEYLEMISAEVRNSSKIISDLLDFSRTRMPDRERVAVSELVAEVLEKRPPPVEVEVITQIAPDLPPVFVDPRQMGQVLVNLVVNAYQAMKEGGRLVIKTSEVSEKPPRSVAISITDTGCGIPEENMAKLFEPLFTTKARGIGLGLAVSKSLVEANGGSIEVESEEGKGSTFTVRLPTREVEV